MIRIRGLYSAFAFLREQGKFYEFATLKHEPYKLYRTAKMAARYLEAAKTITGGEFTKLALDTIVCYHLQGE
jgi:hypothetical protein